MSSKEKQTHLYSREFETCLGKSSSASARPSEAAIAEEKRRQDCAQVLEEAERCRKNCEKINLSDIARKVGLHPQTVSRIINGQSKLDGKGPGGRTKLSSAGEVVVAIIAAKLIEFGVVLHMETFCVIASFVWRFEHPHCSLSTSFTRGWFEGFRKRHPHLQIKSHHVPSINSERKAASNYMVVHNALQSEKVELNAMAGNSSGWIAASHVLFVDETDVSTNDETGGTVGFNVGSIKPKTPTALNDSPHITALVFCDLSAHVIRTDFIVAGAGSVRRDLTLSDAFPPGIIVYNSSGSSEGDSEGLWGSYHIILNAFVISLRSCIPISEPVALITDGLAAHVQPRVRDFLKEHNIIAVGLKPHLTHLIQIQDNANIFGYFKGNLRKSTARTNLQQGGRRLQIEEICVDAWKLLMASHTLERVMQAAKETGFEYKEDSGTRYVRISEESIQAALRMMVGTGKIKPKFAIDGVDDRLRSHEYCSLRRQYRENPNREFLLDHPISESLLQTIDVMSESFLRTQTGQVPTNIPRRVHVKVAPEQAGRDRPATVVLDRQRALINAQTKTPKSRQKRVKQ